MFPERLKLANLPTPIQKLNGLSEELKKDIYVWRDDLTGFAVSGNKIRKLEFLVADALAKKSTYLVTCGGIQSNHVRATAFVARQIGLKPSLLLRIPKDMNSHEELEAQKKSGNLFLNMICGAKLTFIPYIEYEKQGCLYRSFLEKEQKILESQGERPYIVPEGGSTPLGCFGYAAATSEMMETWQKLNLGRHPDALFCALGSGGTYAGLHLGFQINDIPTTKLWAVNICDDEEYFHKRVTNLLQDTTQIYDLPTTNRTLQILDGYVGLGYAKTTPQELRFYLDIAQKEGLVLDPVYTGKAFIGMVSEIKKDPKRFGKKILFLHSGGTFANFSYAEEFLKAQDKE